MLIDETSIVGTAGHSDSGTFGTAGHSDTGDSCTDILHHMIHNQGAAPGWRMGYLENWNQPATDDLPTFAGFHRNLGHRDDEKFHPGFTLRFSDGFYVMVPSIRTQGCLPLDKSGRMKLRCRQRTCKAKALVKCLDHSLITKRDYKTLRSNPELWQLFPHCGLSHTCQQTVPYYFSDKRNFGEDYRSYILKHNTPDYAWQLAQSDWTSGFGGSFDTNIQGRKLDHVRKVETDRAKGLGSQLTTPESHVPFTYTAWVFRLCSGPSSARVSGVGRKYPVTKLFYYISYSALDEIFVGKS